MFFLNFRLSLWLNFTCANLIYLHCCKFWFHVNCFPVSMLWFQFELYNNNNNNHMYIPESGAPIWFARSGLILTISLICKFMFTNYREKNGVPICVILVFFSFRLCVCVCMCVLKIFQIVKVIKIINWINL